MVHIKEKTGRRSIRVFSWCVHRSFSSLRRAYPLGYTYTLTVRSRSPSFLPWRSSCDVATHARSSRIVSRKIGRLRAEGGTRKSRTRKTLGALFRSGMFAKWHGCCGKCDTMQRLQKPGKDQRIAFYRRTAGGVRDRFPSLPRKQKTIVSRNMDDFTSGAKQSPISTRPTHFSRDRSGCRQLLQPALQIASCSPGIRD